MAMVRISTVAVAACLILSLGAMVALADPIVYQPYNIKDNYIDSSNPDDNQGVRAWVNAGHGDGSNNRHIWALIQFEDLSSLPGNVQSVKLELYRYTGSGTGTTVSAYQITSDWVENSVTWNTQPTTNGTAVDTITVTSDLNVWHSIDITSLYNAWKAGTATNYGVEIRTGTNNGETFGYYSSESGTADLRPRLVIVVPEPASMSLVALASLTMWVRRRRQR